MDQIVPKYVETLKQAISLLEEHYDYTWVAALRDDDPHLEEIKSCITSLLGLTASIEAKRISK